MYQNLLKKGKSFSTLVKKNNKRDPSGRAYCFLMYYFISARAFFMPSISAYC